MPGCTTPPPKSGYWWGLGGLDSAHSSLEPEKARETGGHGGNSPPPRGDNNKDNSYNNSDTSRKEKAVPTEWARAWCQARG